MQDTVCNFYGLNEQEEELNALPNEEPEFYEVEATLDTGPSTHAAGRVDFPRYAVETSCGSRAGQLFGCAGGCARARARVLSQHHISGRESRVKHARSNTRAHTHYK